MTPTPRRSIPAMVPFLILLALNVIVIALLVSCASPNRSVSRVAEFQAALAETPGASLVPGSPQEQAAINRVKAFLGSLTPENVRQNTRTTYAEDAYFNDTLNTLRGREAIEAYLLKTAETVTTISVEFDDVARSNADYYFRWRMDFQAPKLSDGEVIRTIGLSQIRFNAEGKVVLHQDYWDSTAGLFEHLPIINPLVNTIRKRL